MPTTVAHSIIGLSEASKLLGEVIGYVGIFVMIVGAAKGLYMFVCRTILQRDVRANIRIELGQHLALGLEFLVGKDIIESLVHPTWDDLGKLCAIIAIRSALTLFLGYELKEAAREAREQAAVHAAKRMVKASM
jgi:uncharacterized membrane protein